MTARRYLRSTLIGLVVAMLFGLLTAGQLVLATMTDSQGYTFGHAVIMQTPLWVFWAPILPGSCTGEVRRLWGWT